MLSRSRTRLREASRHASALQVTVRAADLHESARARTPPSEPGTSPMTGPARASALTLTATPPFLRGRPSSST